jgi:hypothetical protein
MVKPSAPGPTRSKVRILFVDAELAPGDLELLTQTITTAIRPVQVVKPAVPPRLSATAPHAESDADQAVQPDLETEEVAADEIQENGAEQPKPTKPRRYRTPKVVADLDMTAGGTPFEEFAKTKAPDSHTSRYLVAAYWLSEYAKVVPATVDHIYTCYKRAGWTFDPTDPNFPFRELASRERGDGETNRGKFTINHIGKARAEKMGRTDKSDA